MSLIGNSLLRGALCRRLYSCLQPQLNAAQIKVSLFYNREINSAIAT